jgi:hypothetical protein
VKPVPRVQRGRSAISAVEAKREAADRTPLTATGCHHSFEEVARESAAAPLMRAAKPEVHWLPRSITGERGR